MENQTLAGALSEYDIAASLGTTATEIAAARVLARCVRDHIQQAGRDKNTWTVLGIWDNDEAVPVGAIAGRHGVHGEAPGERIRDEMIAGPGWCGFSTSSFYEQGVWAETVEAPDGDTAQDIAAAKMMATLDHDGEDDSEECEAGTCRHPHEPDGARS